MKLLFRVQSIIQCLSHLCTEQLKYIYELSKLREGAEISAVRYTNLNSTFATIKAVLEFAPGGGGVVARNGGVLQVLLEGRVPQQLSCALQVDEQASN